MKLTKRFALLLPVFLLAASAAAQSAYLGFDRNDYPGDAALPALRKTFRFAGYWLNNPPGATRNSWAGKREILRQNGFGFLLLSNGRAYSELKGRDAAAFGTADGKAAAAAALREGFAANALIFLDQEEGGRLLPGQIAYLVAWVDAVRASGARAGVYCSGIDVPDGAETISTARQIAQAESERNLSKGKSAERLAIWIADDRCPPSPGCAIIHPRQAAPFPLAAPGNTPAWAAVWQYAQSPRRAQFSAGCPQNQAPDGNCYAPGLPPGQNTFVDLDLADSPDPSEAPPPSPAKPVK